MGDLECTFSPKMGNVLPGFVTSDMAHDTLRRALLKGFQGGLGSQEF
jgi:hypothetical protein